jgi:hypothetical protein
MWHWRPVRPQAESAAPPPYRPDSAFAALADLVQ